jgi:Ca-activated chloride channel family protein
LLTDGANSQGPHPVDAAQQAADRQVRVFTIGFGTADPREMSCTRQQLGSDVFGRGFGGGGFGGGFSGGVGGDFRRFLVIDETTLQAVADMTGGSYFRAQNADQLYEVFLDLPSQITLQEESLEISVVFVILAAIFATTAIWLSLRWNHFP